MIDKLKQQAYSAFTQNSLMVAIQLYESLIEQQPEEKSYYWYLGLAHLLQKQEMDAQMVWMSAIGDSENEELSQNYQDLIDVLIQEAKRRDQEKDYQTAWELRLYIHELQTQLLNSYLSPKLSLNELLTKLLSRSDEKTPKGEDLILTQVILLLENNPPREEVNSQLLLEGFKLLGELALTYPLTLKYAQLSLKYADPKEQFVSNLMTASKLLYQVRSRPILSTLYAELALTLDPENRSALGQLSIACLSSKDFEKSIQASELAYQLAQNSLEKINHAYALIRVLLIANGYWEQVCKLTEEQSLLLEQFKTEEIDTLDLENDREITDKKIPNFLVSFYHHVFIKDDPRQFRSQQNWIARYCQEKLQHQFPHWVSSKGLSPERLVTDRPLKIGYLSYCFRNHSVGFLARSLIRHHDRKNFKIYGYMVFYQNDIQDTMQQWYRKQFDQAYILGANVQEIVKQIQDDEIDILIDLDSLTLDISAVVMAMKPAPVQVSWLGWDAIGLPAVDYFIADPYVLPDNAQEYYQEKIWRLPETYIATDGFETDISPISRKSLNLPESAILYLTVQSGAKRNPEIMKAQLEIIKNVPDSYLLIKGISEEKAVQIFLEELCIEVGIDRNRIILLPRTKTEAEHRGCLSIADVVLDTYPYNGATTTLETLWMGIPLVTWVGEQFASRNSYGFLKNCDIQLGIAYNREQYVSWGIRLGTDQHLRDQYVLQLKSARRTSPLWKAKRFTREMEQAYQQMWKNLVNRQDY